MNWTSPTDTHSMKGLIILVFIFSMHTSAQTHGGGTDIGEKAIAKICHEAILQVQSSYSTYCKSKKNFDDIVYELMILKSLDHKQKIDRVTKRKSQDDCKDKSQEHIHHCSVTPGIYQGLQKIHDHYKEMKYSPGCDLLHSKEDLKELLDFMKKSLDTSAH